MEEALTLLLGPLGLTVALIFALFANWRGWWVTGRQYDTCVEEKNEWKDAALRALSGAESAAAIGEQLIKSNRADKSQYGKR